MTSLAPLLACQLAKSRFSRGIVCSWQRRCSAKARPRGIGAHFTRVLGSSFKPSSAPLERLWWRSPTGLTARAGRPAGSRRRETGRRASPGVRELIPLQAGSAAATLPARQPSTGVPAPQLRRLPARRRRVLYSPRDASPAPPCWTGTSSLICPARRGSARSSPELGARRTMHGVADAI